MICENAIHRNFQTMPRRFDGLRLHGAGYFPDKSEWVDRAGPTFNYSIILSGRGTFIHNGQKLGIEAPCVFTQFPGVRATYGPLPGTTWEEFYLTIPPEKQGELQAKRLMGKNNHLWSIQNVPTVMRAIRALLPLLETPDQRPGKADRIDARAENIIMETLLPGDKNPDPGSEAVAALAQAMASAPEKNYDIREIANDFGVSFSTFRRRWGEQFDVPPGQYLHNLRIAECCRLMTETDLPIVEIAQCVGIEDPAYFSRIFKQRIGMTPSAYRTIHSEMRR